VSLHADTVSVLVRDIRANAGAAVLCATMLEAGAVHDRQVKVEEVAAMAGTAMMSIASTSSARRLRPWIFLYSEDTDLCYRTWLAGRRS